MGSGVTRPKNRDMYMYLDLIEFVFILFPGAESASFLREMVAKSRRTATPTTTKFPRSRSSRSTEDTEALLGVSLKQATLNDKKTQEKKHGRPVERIYSYYMYIHVSQCFTRLNTAYRSYIMYM